VRIVDILDHAQGVLRTGDRATVQFEFISHPEFMKQGMKILFREGTTRASYPFRPSDTSRFVAKRAVEQGLGVITQLL
jgi:hypothetical protein